MVSNILGPIVIESFRFSEGIFYAGCGQLTYVAAINEKTSVQLSLLRKRFPIHFAPKAE